MTFRSALAAAALAACCAAPAAGGELAPELRRAASAAAPAERLAVIVRLDRPEPSADGESGRALGRRSALLRELRARADVSATRVEPRLRALGADRVRRLWAVGAIAASVPASELEALARLDGVRDVRLDARFDIGPITTASAAGSSWNLAQLGVAPLWNLGIDGTGVVVALLDSGVDARHQDLAPGFRGGPADWFDPHGEHDEPSDRNGHGTAVAGVLVGGSSTGEPIGVAPGARWIAAKVFDDAGTTTLSAIHQAFQWALDPDGSADTDDAPDVINASWGFPQLAGQCFLEFEEDIALARQSGIAVVFSAGNEGPAAASGVSPANNPGVLSVGSLDDLQRVDPTSSRGPSACGEELFPKVTAPGVNVRSADLTFGGLFPTSFRYVSGTSFAAPHVAGIAALLAQSFPHAGAEAIEAAIRSGARDLGVPGADHDSGHGAADATGAFLALAEALGVVPAHCADRDRDGFYGQEMCGTPVDCNDDDGATHPGACDAAGDGTDRDCDGSDSGACPARTVRRRLATAPPAQAPAVKAHGANS
ncbi:MAG: S8 family peptidase [Acidobacteriota bacterium]